MSIEMIALMEVVTRAGYETEVILGKLQTEPSAKVLHGLQGENAGCARRSARPASRG